MGGGKGGSKVKLPQYHMTIHYGICHGPLESINQIFVKEKPIWCGSMTSPQSILVDQPDLFGGMDKEGGVAGMIDAYFGTEDQIMSDEIASRFGLTGATMPAYRGIANLFFRNKDSQNGGFYWIGNNPYLPGTWVNASRAPNPPQLGSSVRRWIVGPGGGGGGGSMGPLPVYYTDGDRAVFDLHDYADLVDSNQVDVRIRFTYTAILQGNPTDTGAGAYFDFFDDSAVTSSGTPTTKNDFDFGLKFSNPDPSGNPWSTYITANPSGVPVDFSATVPPGARWVVFYARIVPALPFFTTVTVLESAATFSSDSLPKWGSQCDPNGSLAGLPDANPSYMIFECLTDRNWGMSAPDTTINIQSFKDAAKTLFNEKFGLSMLWSRQMSIEKFIMEILDHIQGTLFLDPKTGLWTLKLIRGDYDPATLKVLDPSNCEATNRQRKGTGELINEIVVSYKDADTEEDLTITFHDIASIAQVGEIVSETRNYYGIRNSRLANQVGARDIRSASYPLFSADIVANREFRDVRPGSVLRFSWPEDGIVDMVVRVMKVDYGRPGESRVRFNVVEDIFSLPVTTYTSVAESAWEPLDAPPQPLTLERFITAPLPLLLRSGVALSDLNDSDYPKVQNIIFGDDPGQNIDDIKVYSDITQPNGDVVTGSVGTILPSGSAVLAGALPEEASSVMDGATIRACAAPATPQPGNFFYMDGADTEGELLMLDSYDSNLDQWVVARGIFDTVPKPWAVGDLLWWIGGDIATIYDPLEASDSVAASYFLLPRTGGGLLALADATQIDYTPGPRPYAPFRPANTQIDGNGFGGAFYTDAGASSIPATIPLTWSNRNRTTEDTIAKRWDEATVTEEANQTTIIRVRERDTGVLAYEATGLTGTSHDLPTAGLTSTRFFVVEFIAERDGYTSIQWATRDLEIERVGYGYDYGYVYGG